MQIAIPGWRGRLVFDAYARLPDGVGSHKLVVDSYVDLAETRGHSLPKNPTHIKQTIKDEVHRLSSDSSVYAGNGWNKKRPDLFHRLERGRWGLRPVVLTQANDLFKGNGHSLLGALIPASPPIVPLLFENEPLDSQRLYIMEMLAIPGIIEIRPEYRIIKIGIGNPEARQASLQTGNPSRIIERFAVHGRNAPAIENKLHNALDDYRLVGEWFAVTPSKFGEIGAMIALHNMG